MSNIQDILEKVRKLQALSKSTNLNEAANAAAAAEKLIAAHRISQAELSAERKISEPIIRAQAYLYDSAKIVQWKSNLSLRLAHHYGVYVYNEVGKSDKGRKTTNYVMMGRDSDIQILQYVFDYLTKEISNLADLCVFTWGRGVSAERNSFCLGAVDGIMQKLTDEKNAIERSATSAALVVLNNKRSEAEQYTRDLFRQNGERLERSKRQASHGQFNQRYYNEGREHGKNIQINSGLNGGETKKLT